MIVGRRMESLGCGASEINTSDKTANGDNKVFEANRKFIDIHFMIDGEETFGYANVNDLRAITEYNDKEDYLLLNGNINRIRLGNGDFCIVFPEDAHIPAMEYGGSKKAKKAIVKIPL